MKQKFAFIKLVDKSLLPGISSDERLTNETSGSECLYGGRFTLSTQLINPNLNDGRSSSTRVSQ